MCHRRGPRPQGARPVHRPHPNDPCTGGTASVDDPFSDTILNPVAVPSGLSGTSTMGGIDTPLVIDGRRVGRPSNPSRSPPVQNAKPTFKPGSIRTKPRYWSSTT